MTETDNGGKDFVRAFGLGRLGPKIMGVWPINEDNMSKSLFTKLRVPCMILTIFFFIILPQFCALVLVIDDLLLVINNIMISFTGFLCCLKLFFLWRSQTELQPVVESMIKDWQRPKTNWEVEAMKQESFWLRTFTIFDFTLLSICYMGFMIGPFLGFDIRIISNITDYGSRHLIFQASYPYDYSKSPHFELTILTQMIGSFFMSLSINIPDYYFGALIFHISGQFLILNSNIELNFIQQTNSVLTNSKTNDIDKKFGICIERHIHLMRTIDTVEKSFTFIITSQIFVMTVLVCCLGILLLSQLQSKSTTLQVFVIMGSMVNEMLRTFFYFFANESLASRSSEIFFNIYNSCWYILPKKKIRCIMIMMIMSKTSKRIKIGKVFDTSFKTYCNIVILIFRFMSMLFAFTRKRAS